MVAIAEGAIVPGIVEGDFAPGEVAVLHIELAPRAIAWFEVRPK